MIRRAIVLRGQLERFAGHLVTGPKGVGEIEIDPGASRAFLSIPCFKHGARSMETIIKMSLLSGRRTYERSSLPSEEQLNVHVDGREFMNLVQPPDLIGTQLENLSMWLNESYSHKKPRHDEAVVRRNWESLPEKTREQNRASIRSLPRHFAALGYVLTKHARTDAAVAGGHLLPVVDLPKPIRDRLVELEHERWVESRLAEGWTWAARRMDERKQHDMLLPWRKLSAIQQAKNDVFVDNLLVAMQRAHYTCSPLHGQRRHTEPVAHRTIQLAGLGHRYLHNSRKVAEAVARVLDHIIAVHRGVTLHALSPMAEGSALLLVAHIVSAGSRRSPSGAA